MKAQLPKYLTGLMFLASIVVLQWIQRDDFWLLSTIYLIAFIGYTLLASQYKNDTRFLALSATVGALSFFWSSPQLSEDVYRFLWDGKLWHLGINPYSLPPTEVVSTNTYLTELYPQMTELTKGNYTCYPGFNQLYFFVAALTAKVSHSILLLKLLFVISIIPGLIYLHKLLNSMNLQPTAIWLLVLNPLFLLETLGNLHFEAIMMSFLIIAFYYLKRILWLSALCFSMAVQIKLLPLIVLPFLVRYIGLKKSILYGTVVLTLNAFSMMILMDTAEMMNFLQSLRLYFGIFEFNSFIPYYLQSFVEVFTGFDPIRYTSPVLSVITLGAIIYFALNRKKESLIQLIQGLSFGLLCYFLLNSTVHPWYLITIIFLLPFVGQRTIVLWSMVGVLSYGFYTLDPWISRILVNLEYAIVLISLILECRSRKINHVNDHVS
jgi:hypothetical protein